MTNPLVPEPSSAAQHEETADLNRRDPDESGYFRTLEEIVNRVYPQPEES
jgi:hypothetical protein